MLGFSSEMWLPLTLVLKGLQDLLLSQSAWQFQKEKACGVVESWEQNSTVLKFLFRGNPSDISKYFCWSQKEKLHDLSDTFSFSFLQMMGIYIFQFYLWKKKLSEMLYRFCPGFLGELCLGHESAKPCKG